MLYINSEIIKAMEMKEQLITQDTLELTPNTLENSYFIYRYNEVIDFWNQNSNDVTLESLDNSPFFFQLHKLLSKNYIKILLVLFLTFAPFINLFIFGLFFFYYFYLRREGLIHKKNLKKIPNPFENY